MKEFYVYIYLDPRKPGDFNYGSYRFDFEPFYVGKGHNGRLYEHLKLVGNNHLKNNKVKKILKSFTKNEFKTDYIVKYSGYFLECQAIKLEIDMIKTIGRLDLKVGPLTNLTDGGEGLSGRIFSKETREKISESNRNRKYSEKTKKKISESNKRFYMNGGIHNKGMKNKNHTKQAKQKISNGNKGKRRSKNAIKKYSVAKLGKNNPQAKSVIIDNILYHTMKEACDKLNISYRQLKERI